MQVLFSFILTISSLFPAGTDEESAKIMEEARLLFRLEKASWYGTDDMLEHYPDKKDSIGGYLSYITDNNKVNTIFYSRFNLYHILIRYQFDSVASFLPVSVDITEHKPTSHERDLITIRNDAFNSIYIDENPFFTYYENTAFNIIPLINDNVKKVYVLTAPRKDGIILLGNDYLLTYGSNNTLIKKKKIHESLIELPFQGVDEEKKIETSMHTHVNSSLIDATDICTILLYKDYIEWNQHIVISKKYVSIFNIEKEDLVVITKKAWERMKRSFNE